MTQSDTLLEQENMGSAVTVRPDQVPGAWLREGLTIYALEPCGFRRGAEQFRNRWHVHVQRGPDTPVEELEAVARKMAAADDLLKACIELKELFRFALLSTTPDIAKDGMEFIRNAEAIIAKATGAQTL